MKLIILYHYLVSKFMIKMKSSWFNNLMIQFRLRSLVSYLTQHSKYYERLKGTPFFDWPVINKKVMLSQFNEMNTKEIDRDKAFELAKIAESDRSVRSEINGVTLGLSSGTSNIRGLVMASKFERAVWAGLILAKCLPYSIVSKQKIALFLRANSDIYGDVRSKTIEFRYFALNESLDENIKQLNLYQPDVLVSPPSMLRRIADAHVEGKIQLKPIKIISVAEVLDPIDEKYIQNVFKMKIHQIYQCTEGFLASTCEFGTLHLNEDFLIVDKHFLDEEKRKFMPVLTDTLRITQPIVKYEHNDILTLKKDKCLCGSQYTALECIEGRTDDIFLIKDKEERLIKFYPEILRKAVFDASDSIQEYKLVQESETLLTLALKSVHIDDDFNRVKVHLENIFTAKSCHPPEIKLVPYIDHELYIKLRRIECRLSN